MNAHCFRLSLHSAKTCCSSVWRSITKEKVARSTSHLVMATATSENERQLRYIELLASWNHAFPEYNVSTSNLKIQRLADIGANLLDPMYDGEYHGKHYHEPDRDAVLERAWQAGVQKIIITAGNLEESKAALQLARTDHRLFCTVGVHPTRCNEFEEYSEGPEAYMAELSAVLAEGKAAGKVVAVGECGLDYDREQFCDRSTQQRYFEAQFELVRESGLPMFLHMRAAASDFLATLLKHLPQFRGVSAVAFHHRPKVLNSGIHQRKIDLFSCCATAFGH